jgi:L-cystine uptake protein TcyP (sodium:dicarboxylate symporter family)
MQVAALSSIFAALAATLIAMRMGAGVLSPQAVGILIGAVVMVGFGVVGRRGNARG